MNDGIFNRGVEMVVLRDYQEDFVQSIRGEFKKGESAVIAVSPTGSGKTLVAARISEMAIGKGKRVMFIAPRRDLIIQTSRVFFQNNIHNTVLMAGYPYRHGMACIIASMYTLHSRVVRRKVMGLPDVDLVMVDECHLSISNESMQIIQMYKDKGANIIGFTATPARADGIGLGSLYDTMVTGPTVESLVMGGWLCESRYFAPTSIDTSSLRTSKSGDYVLSDSEEVMAKDGITGDILDNWKRIANGKSTVIFCVSRKHARHVANEFINDGINTVYVDGDTPAHERANSIKMMTDGSATVLVNVFVATYGLDIPRLEVAVLARPTKSISMYLQSVGRVLRVHPSKPDGAIIIDHVGCVSKHGFATDHIPWSLHSDGDVSSRSSQIKIDNQEDKEIICSSCGYCFKGTRICPLCSHGEILQSEEIPVLEHDLKEIFSGTQHVKKSPVDFMSWLKNNMVTSLTER
ncbi:hypothetical protein BOW52_10530 [Solemya elarraichensis gill symbiont]|uniref:Helicase n=2 Tax=Solemya elarraichensis gill symbiont TaxID=1918949 RepID=A0A1T2KVG5_9GAMM|nr:hypothetical protein BOW52_10530 [Solemya elarraichensis gill symbiont]